MGGWNAMTYDGRDTILRVVRRESEQFFDMAGAPGAWERPTSCPEWQVRDVVGHLVDTTESYFVGFDAAHGRGGASDAYGLPGMAERVNTQARSLRAVPQGELIERARADYEDLKLLLPEQRELTMVLQNVQDRAKGRLTLTKFSPQEEVQQDFYTGKPVAVEVTGNYNSLGQFFAQMASYQRIVSITDFKVTKLKDKDSGESKANQTVSAEFLVTAYYVSPEKLQAPAPEPEGNKDKKDKGKKDKAAPKAESAE